MSLDSRLAPKREGIVLTNAGTSVRRIGLGSLSPRHARFISPARLSVEAESGAKFACGRYPLEIIQYISSTRSCTLPEVIEASPSTWGFVGWQSRHDDGSCYSGGSKPRRFSRIVNVRHAWICFSNVFRIEDESGKHTSIVYKRLASSLSGAKGELAHRASSTQCELVFLFSIVESS